jgi:diacylglycerol O-acyltransferase / wax synthase
MPAQKPPLNLGLAPKTIFNDSITNQRSYSTLSLSQADIKALSESGAAL